MLKPAFEMLEERGIQLFIITSALMNMMLSWLINLKRGFAILRL
jgi:hypothetical protein